MIDPVKTRRLAPRWKNQVADYVSALAWSPDGISLAVATGAGTLELFAGADGTAGRKREAHALGIDALAWTPGGIFTGSQDGRLRSWDETGASALTDLKAGKGWIGHLVWSGHPVRSPGGGEQPLLAVSCGKEALICDAWGHVLQRITDKKTTVEDLAWYPNGSILLTAGYGGVQAWNPQDGSHLRTFEWASAFWSCTWSPDGRWITGGSQENAVHIWEPETGDHMHMPDYEGKVRHQDWSPDSRWLATAGGLDIILWDCEGRGPEGRNGKSCAAHADVVTALEFHPKNNHLISGCKAGRLILWNADGEDEILAAAVFDQEISALAWSPVDDRVAVGTARGMVAVFQHP
jgi:WD40 repeat protein